MNSTTDGAIPEAALPRTQPGTMAQRCAAARCRVCGGRGLVPILDLGMMPASDRLLSAEDLDEPEARYPLELAFCERCTLVQIVETVAPGLLFGQEYLYYSSCSPQLLAHARSLANHAMQRYGLDRDSFVVELASNDGYLLQNFVDAGVPVLGVDPAPHQAHAANQRGIPTRQAFFSARLADELVERHRPADLIIGCNVLAHVADTNDFVQGVARLLADRGTAVFEMPYVKHLIDRREFDTIYHEHLCYFSVSSLDALFRRHDLHLNDVQPLDIHGGSLRVSVQHHPGRSARVQRMLEQERACGLTGRGYYESFAERVQALGRELGKMVGHLSEKGHSIAAYGAAAKGTILLNYTGLNHETIRFVVDRNVHKHGRYMPGVRVPIVPVQRLLEQMPDYTLMLPWNFQEEILHQQRHYSKAGGRFIVPVPEVRVVA